MERAGKKEHPAHPCPEGTLGGGEQAVSRTLTIRLGGEAGGELRTSEGEDLVGMRVLVVAVQEPRREARRSQ